MDVYNSNDFNVELKGYDSPLTKADKKARLVIVTTLKETDLPIVFGEDAEFVYSE